MAETYYDLDTNKHDEHEYLELSAKRSTKNESVPKTFTIRDHSTEKIKANLNLSWKKIVILIIVITVVVATILTCVFAIAVFFILKTILINEIFEKMNVKTQDCGSAPAVINSISTIINTRVGQMSTYRCKDGFRIDGNPEIFCQQNGSWPDVLFFCAKDCQSGWSLYNNSCYLVSSLRKTWTDAEIRCRSLNGTLAEINDAREFYFVRKITFEQGITGYYWLGGTDIETENEWKWVGSGQRLKFTVWQDGEPNNDRGTEHCLTAMNSGWNDNTCNKTFSFICERKLVQDGKITLG